MDGKCAPLLPLLWNAAGPIGPTYSSNASDHNVQDYTRLVLTCGFAPRVAKLNNDSTTRNGLLFTKRALGMDRVWLERQ